jgi:hypothetical protein
MPDKIFGHYFLKLLFIEKILITKIQPQEYIDFFYLFEVK